MYILANALAGGIGGYYTNDYAVKMIFRKYWGMGGVIIDTRPEFIANMSKLVERDVLNVHTLVPALKNEPSKLVLFRLLADFWQGMRADAQQDTLGQVPGIDRSLARLLDFHKNYAQGPLGNTLAALLRDINLSDVLKGGQCQYLATTLYKLGLAELDKSAVISNSLLEYQKCYAQRPITDFIPAEFFEKVADNLRDALEDMPRTLKADEVELQLSAVIEQTYVELECDSLLDAFEESLKEKSLFELLGYERVQGIGRELLQKLVKTLQSEAGQQLLEKLSVALFAELKRVDISMYKFLNDGLRKKLDAYLQRVLPSLMQHLLVWVQANKTELDSLINKAVEQVLNEDDDLLGLKNEAKKLLKDLFIGDVAAKYELIAKITDCIKAGADPHKAAHELSEYIILQLKKRRVGELLTSLEEIGVIRSEDGGRLLLTVLEKYLPQFNLQGLDTLFSRKVGEFINIKLHTYFAEYFKEHLKVHLRDELLCAPHSAEYIKLELRDRLHSLSEQKLAYFLDAEAAATLGLHLQQAANNHLQAQAEEFSAHLAENISGSLQGKRLDWAINDEMQQKIKSYIAEQSFDKLQQLLEMYKTKKLVAIYNILSSKMDAEQLSAFLGTMLTGSLDKFLKGKVEQAVADNLQQLSNEELQSLTEKFMGSELQPLSRLGGGMGASIAGVAAAAGLNTLSPNLALNVLASGTMFATIGWLTNVAAIQMLFRPYHAYKIAAWRIPFTPGIIPRQKPRFAGAMGEFIDQKLFVQEHAVRDFLNKQDAARASLLELVYSNDYAHLQGVLQAQQGQLSRWSLNFISNNIHSGREYVQGVLQDEFSRLPLGVLEHDWLSRALTERKPQLFAYAEEFLNNKLGAQVSSQTALGEAIPTGMKLHLRRGVDNMLTAEINVLLEQLQDEHRFSSLLDRYSSNFDSFVQTPVVQMLDVERTIQLKHACGSFVLEKIQTESSCQNFYSWLNECLERELQGDKTLGEVMDGALLQLTRASSEHILTAILERGLNVLSSQRESIKQEFHRQFMESAGLLLKTANMILDIDATIYQSIDRVIDVELKQFAERKKSELQELVLNFVDNKLSDVRISELGIALSYRQVFELVKRTLQSPHTANAINYLVDSLIGALLALNVKQLLQVSNFRSLQNIYQSFWPEIRILRYQLANNIHARQAILVTRAGNLLERVFMDSIYQLPLSRVLFGVNKELLLHAGKRLLTELQQGEIFNAQLDQYVKGLEYELRFQSLDKLLDIKLLSHDLLDCISDSMNSPQLQTVLRGSIHEFYGQLIKNIPTIFKDSTKSYFLKPAVSSFVGAMSEHFADLLRAMDIRAVAVQQLEAMPAAKIKQMFDSFAATYFRRIERYGLIAGLLGLLTVPLLALLK